MKEQFQSFTQLCTRSLADDPALRLEVGHELEGHLEDACAEERSEGKSEAEAEDQAKKRFGEPEELAQSLLDANRRKLKLRARIRLAAKIALIPAILIGLALCIDLRMLTGFTLLCKLGDPWGFPYAQCLPDEWFRPVMEHELNHLPESERDLVRANLLLCAPRGKSPWEKACYEANPESPLFTANYALSLAQQLDRGQGEKERAEYLRVLERGRRIDPDNALYDYLEADLVLRSALTFENDKYEIRDRAALDRGMRIYLAALQKPFARTYAMDLSDTICRRLNPANDYLGMLERISIYSTTPMNFISIERKLTIIDLFYGELLLKEGKTAEAEPYFNAWRKFIPQIQKFDSRNLIEALVGYSCIKLYREAAEKRGDTAEAETLAKIYAPMKNWKEKGSRNTESLAKHSGMLTEMLLPPMREEVPADQFAPDRRLTYLLFDLAGLAVLSILLTICILFLAVAVAAARLMGKRPFLLLLPWKSYLRILVWGIAVPIAAFLLYTHIDALGGRDLSVRLNHPRLWAGFIGIILVFPVIFELVYLREQRKLGKHLGFRKGILPFATTYLNQLFAFAALLLITGCVLRPLLTWECRYYIAENKLFSADRGYTQVEVETGNRLNAELADAIAAANQKP